MKRSSYFATPRTRWEELAAADSLRPISTCGVHAACAGVGDPAGRAHVGRTPGQRSVASMPAGRRPFEAHRNTAKLEVERSDSAARVRSARSGPLESALSVHAAPDAVVSSAYSRRQRQRTSGATLPGVRSRTPSAGMVAAELGETLEPSTSR